MAKKYKNFQNKIKSMEMEDMEDLSTNEIVEERGVSKFHKKDGTEFNKKDKPNYHKVKPFRTYDDGL